MPSPPRCDGEDSFFCPYLEKNVSLQQNIFAAMRIKSLIVFVFCMCTGVVWAQHGPTGLLDDMLSTNSRLQLTAAVVHFGLDDDDLDAAAWRELDAAVALMKAEGEGATFYLVGSADVPSASLRSKRKLAARRCRSVYDALVDKLGVEKKSLTLLEDGGFSEVLSQKGCRMVLIIKRTADTEAVVERWLPTY